MTPRDCDSANPFEFNQELIDKNINTAYKNALGCISIGSGSPVKSIYGEEQRASALVKDKNTDSSAKQKRSRRTKEERIGGSPSIKPSQPKDNQESP